MRATCASPSPGSTPTRASRPGPMAPTISPSTVTRASVTRWIRASMGGDREWDPGIVRAKRGLPESRSPNTARMDRRGLIARSGGYTECDGRLPRPLPLLLRRPPRPPALALADAPGRWRRDAHAAPGFARGAGGTPQPRTHRAGPASGATRGTAAAHRAHHRTPGDRDAAVLDAAAHRESRADPGAPRR